MYANYHKVGLLSGAWFGVNRSAQIQTPVSKHFQAYLQNFPERVVPLEFARGFGAVQALETRGHLLDFVQEDSVSLRAGIVLCSDL